MNRPLDEKKVLKKLRIKDFRHLNKKKVIKLASMLDKVDPEVAKKALEQFPEFANVAKEIVAANNKIIEAGLEANNASVKEAYSILHKITDSLSEELKKENLSGEERTEILRQLNAVADKVVELDKQNKKFLAKVIGVVGTSCIAVICIVASVIGGNSNINLDHDDSDEDEDVA